MATITMLSAAAFAKLLVPDGTVEKLDAEIEAQPDKTTEESGAEALAWLERNLSYVRGILDIAGSFGNPYHPDLEKRFQEARLVLLASYKRRRKERAYPP